MQVLPVLGNSGIGAVVYIEPGDRSEDLTHLVDTFRTFNASPNYSHIESDAAASKAAPSDKPTTGTHTEAMNDSLSRPELDAKLEAMEARMDARVASIEGKIDAFLAAATVREKSFDKAIDRVEADVSSMRTELRNSIGSMKTALITTGIVSVLTIVIGVAGFNAMLTSNMLAAYQAGKGELQTAQPTEVRKEAPAPELPPAIPAQNPRTTSDGAEKSGSNEPPSIK